MVPYYYLLINFCLTTNHFNPLLTSEAEIAITLRNSGIEAYKPEDYGHSITVVRVIKREGGGAYKLKSSSGIAPPT